LTATDTNGGNILKKLSDHSLSWSECSPLIFQRSPYDGQAVAQDKTSTNVITEYLNGPGIDNKIRQKAGNTLYYFAQDHLGSTTALTDSKARWLRGKPTTLTETPRAAQELATATPAVSAIL